MIRKRDLFFIFFCWAMIVGGLVVAILVPAIDILSVIYGAGVGVGLMVTLRLSDDFMDWINRRGRQTQKELVFYVDQVEINKSSEWKEDEG